MKSKLIHYNYDKPQYHWIKSKVKEEKELNKTYGEYSHSTLENTKYFEALPTDPNETYYVNNDRNLHHVDFNNLNDEGVNEVEAYKIEEYPNVIGKYAKIKKGVGFIGENTTKQNYTIRNGASNNSTFAEYTNLLYLPYNESSSSINWKYSHALSNNFLAPIEHLIKDPVFDGNRISAQDVLIIEITPPTSPVEETDIYYQFYWKYYNKDSLKEMWETRDYNSLIFLLKCYECGKDAWYSADEADVKAHKGVITFSYNGIVSNPNGNAWIQDNGDIKIPGGTNPIWPGCDRIIKYSDQDTGYYLKSVPLSNSDNDYTQSIYRFCKYNKEDNTYELNPTGTSLVEGADIYAEIKYGRFPIIELRTDSYYYLQGGKRHLKFFHNVWLAPAPNATWTPQEGIFSISASLYMVNENDPLITDYYDDYVFYDYVNQGVLPDNSNFDDGTSIITNWQEAFEILDEPDEAIIQLPCKIRTVYTPNTEIWKAADAFSHRLALNPDASDYYSNYRKYNNRYLGRYYSDRSNDLTSNGTINVGQHGFEIKHNAYTLNPNFDKQEYYNDDLNFIRIVELLGNIDHYLYITDPTHPEYDKEAVDRYNAQVSYNSPIYGDTMPIKFAYPLSKVRFTTGAVYGQEREELKLILSTSTPDQLYSFLKNKYPNFFNYIKILGGFSWEYEQDNTDNTITIIITPGECYTYKLGKNFLQIPHSFDPTGDYESVDKRDSFYHSFSNILLYDVVDAKITNGDWEKATNTEWYSGRIYDWCNLNNTNYPYEEITCITTADLVSYDPDGYIFTPLFPNLNNVGLYKDLWDDSYYISPNNDYTAKIIYTKQEIPEISQGTTTGISGKVYYDINRFKYKYGDIEWAPTMPEEDLTGYDDVVLLQDDPIREFYVVPEEHELIYDNYPIPNDLDITKPYYKFNELEQNNKLIYASPEATQKLVFNTAWDVLKYRFTKNLIGIVNNGEIITVSNGILPSYSNTTPIISPARLGGFVRIKEDGVKYINPQFSYAWPEWVKRTIPTNTLTHGEYIPAQRILTQNLPYGYKEDRECWYFDNSGFITIHTETGYTKNIIGRANTNNKFKDYRVGFISLKDYAPIWLVWSSSANDNEDFGFYHIKIDEPEWVGNTKLKYKAIKGEYVEPPQLISYTYEDKVSPYTEWDRTLTTYTPGDYPTGVRLTKPRPNSSDKDYDYMIPTGWKYTENVPGHPHYGRSLDYCLSEPIDFDNYYHRSWLEPDHTTDEYIIDENPNLNPVAPTGYAIEEKGILYEPPGAYTIEGDLLIGNVSYDKVINNSQSLDFKTIASASISANINAPVEETNKLVGKNFIYAVDYGDGKWRYMGLFNIEDAILEDAYTSSITGHDFLNRLNVYIDEFIDNTQYPITLKDLYYNLLTYCGINYKEQNFINEGLILQDNFKAVKTTATQILQYITELAGGFVHIGPDLIAHLDYYKNNDITIRPENYSKITYNGYEAGRINQIKLAYNDDQTVITTTPADNPNIYYLLDNALIVYSISEEKGLEVINNILDYVKTLPTYRPATLDMFMAPYNVDIQPGDIIRINTPDNMDFNMYIMEVHIDSSGISYSSYGEKNVPVDGSQFNSQIIYLKDLRQEIDDIKNATVDGEETGTETALLRTIRANKVRSENNAKAIEGLQGTVADNAQIVEDYNLGYNTRFGKLEQGLAATNEKVEDISNTISKHKVSKNGSLASITLDKTVNNIVLTDYLIDMPKVSVNTNMINFIAGSNGFGIDPVAHRMYIKLGDNTYYFTITPEVEESIDGN